MEGVGGGAENRGAPGTVMELASRPTTSAGAPGCGHHQPDLLHNLRDCPRRDNQVWHGPREERAQGAGVCNKSGESQAKRGRQVQA